MYFKYLLKFLPNYEAKYNRGTLNSCLHKSVYLAGILRMLAYQSAIIGSDSVKLFIYINSHIT